MPPKKKGKGNKLARMTEEEKLRYLQHRAALEEEARRRKEHVIASYMKNKLKHEEGFTRLNTAKINQQWRQILRQIKNTELHEASETLRQMFEVALKTKNNIINSLRRDLEESAKQHSLAVQTHLITIDKIQEIRERRLSALSSRFKVAVDRNVFGAQQARGRLDRIHEENQRVMKAIIDCEKTHFERNHKSLEHLAREHTNDLLHQLMAETKQTAIEGKIKVNGLKRIIAQTESDYFQEIKPIQGHYEELISNDDKNTKSIVDNENSISEYTKVINKLTEDHKRHLEEPLKEVAQLESSIEDKKKEHMRLKKLLKDTLTASTDKLQQFAKLSDQVISDLTKVHDDVREIVRYTDACENLLTEDEIVLLDMTTKPVEDDEDVPLGELTNFWQRFGRMQVEVGNYEMRYSSCLEEITSLKQMIQSSMETIARPSTVPSSLYRTKIEMKMRSSSAKCTK